MLAWRIQRNIQRRKDKAGLFELGFSTFFLNRTNVSGVLTGGVIGSLSQAGNYKIDARFYRHGLIRRIEKIAKLRDRITVTQVDAIELIKSDSENTFMYLDPPYVKKAKKLYKNTYNEDDHRKIASSVLSKDKTKWVLSYDRNDLTKELYGEVANKTCWNLSYGISNRSGTEDIYIHPDLQFEKSKSYLT